MIFIVLNLFMAIIITYDGKFIWKQVKFNKLEFSSVIYQFIQNFILTMSAHKKYQLFQKATVIWLHHWIFEYLWSVCYQGSVAQWCFVWKCLILLIFSYNPAEEEKGGGFSKAWGGQFQADRFSKINPIKFLEKVVNMWANLGGATSPSPQHKSPPNKIVSPAVL